MTLRRWPDTLPDPSRGYRHSPVEQSLRTDMEVGAQRVRRISRADLRRLSLRYRFSPAEMALFEAWYRDGAWSLAGDSDNLTGWTPAGVTITSAGTGPDDQVATLLTETAATSVHRGNFVLPVSPSDRLVMCASLKAAGRNFARLALGDATATGRYASIDLTSGAIATQSGLNSVAVKARGNGWYRLTIDVTVDPAATGPRMFINCMADGTTSTSYLGDGTSGIRACEVMARLYTGADLFGRTDADGNLTGADGGSAWVEMPLTFGGEALEYREARFAGPYDAEAKAGFYWEVGAEMEVRNA